MLTKCIGGRLFLIGSLVAFSLPLSGGAADARTKHGTAAYNAHLSSIRKAKYSARWGRIHYANYLRSGGGPLQCVPFARNESGIEIVGNAWTWWEQAAGVYQRGSAPEPGAVLAFQSNRTMRLGHVAVVSEIVNDREIEIEHANWGPGIKRDVRVIDVSPSNDWTAVRVALDRNNDSFGDVYPTHGFIYDRPDRGMMVASHKPPAPMPVLDPPQRDLREADGYSMARNDRMPEPIAMSFGDSFEEVAEAPLPYSVHHRRTHHAR